MKLASTLGKLAVTWPDEDTLNVFLRDDTQWRRMAPNDDLLETLPERFRYRISPPPRYYEGWDTITDVYVSRFADCQWSDVSASGRGGGVSNSVAWSRAPALAVADGRVCVAWSEFGADADPNVLLRCHD